MIVPQAGKVDRPFRRYPGNLALTAEAVSPVDGRAEGVELAVDHQRRDGDRRDLVVFRVELVEFVLQFRHGQPAGMDLAEQPQCDGPVGLDEQFAIQFGVGERLDLDLVADLQFVRIGLFRVRQPIDHVQIVVGAEPVFVDLSRSRRTDVFALGIPLPPDLPHALPPGTLTGAPAHRLLGAVDAQDIVGSRRSEALARLDLGVANRRRHGFGSVRFFRRCIADCEDG